MKPIALAILVSFLLIGCTSRPNRACILAENALKQTHKEGSCQSVSLGETEDTAIWRFDDGERICKDAIGAEHPLPCTVMQPTKDEAAANAAAEAKAKIEADAKTKAEAEAKARADVAAGDREHIRMHQENGDFGSGRGSAKSGSGAKPAP